jgi:AbrB family looped-hinge helix DNA binding protein
MVNGIFDGMNRRLKIDAAGRIVLPRPVRRQFHLESGSILNLEIERDAIVLRPMTHEATLVEENGLLVHEGEPSGDLLKSVESARQRRDRDVSGQIG